MIRVLVELVACQALDGARDWGGERGGLTRQVQAGDEEGCTSAAAEGEEGAQVVGIGLERGWRSESESWDECRCRFGR